MVERVARFVEADILRQPHRQLRARHRNDAAVGAVHDGNRAAPIALARAAPVAQAVLDLAAAAADRLQTIDRGALGQLLGISVVHYSDKPVSYWTGGRTGRPATGRGGW